MNLYFAVALSTQSYNVCIIFNILIVDRLVGGIKLFFFFVGLIYEQLGKWSP
jgi:hypothetical protein